MQKSETKRLDQRGTSERGKARKTEKHGQKGYSKKSSKGSSRSRGRSKSGKAGGGKRRQSDKRGTAYKLADLLPDETIKKLKELKR